MRQIKKTMFKKLNFLTWTLTFIAFFFLTALIFITDASLGESLIAIYSFLPLMFFLLVPLIFLQALIYRWTHNCHQLGAVGTKFSPKKAVLLTASLTFLAFISEFMVHFTRLCYSNNPYFLLKFLDHSFLLAECFAKFLVLGEIWKISMDFKNWKAIKTPKILYGIFLFAFTALFVKNFPLSLENILMNSKLNTHNKQAIIMNILLFHHILDLFISVIIAWKITSLQKAAIARFMQERETQTA